jgi:DNA polymerase-3 subunit epsilon
VAIDSLELVVIAASDDEIVAHQAVLDGLDKAVKGTSVWRLETVPAADEQAA